MKRIFIDTNILLDHALSRPGFEVEAKQVLEWCMKNAESSYFAFHTFSNLYYVLRSQRDRTAAVTYLKGLLSWADVAPTSKRQLSDSVADANGDVEDKLQFLCAKDAGAEVIVTRDPKGFSDSPVPVLSPAEFLAKV